MKYEECRKSSRPWVSFLEGVTRGTAAAVVPHILGRLHL